MKHITTRIAATSLIIGFGIAAPAFSETANKSHCDRI
jgi:hypothetical protein